MTGHDSIPSPDISGGARRKAEGEPPRMDARFADHRSTGPETMLRLLDPGSRSRDADPDLDSEYFESGVSGTPSSLLAEDPAAIAAAVLFGRALDRTPSILDRVRNGSPVLIVDCPSDGLVEPMAEVLERCFGSRSTGPKNRESAHIGAARAVVVKAWAQKAGVGGQPRETDLWRAFRGFRPLICVAAPERPHLPVAVERSWEERIALGPLDPADLTLITRQIVGSNPTTTVPTWIAAQVDAMDLRIALHRERGADGAIDRLRTVVERRAARPTVDDAPRLSDLTGYGAAAEWGIAAAADLAAFGRGKLPWSECEPGVLLSGPPGVGKTMFASALAREADAPFLAGSLAQWQADGEAHLGTTLKAMLAFFRKAREIAPCVALVDELDSFGDRRRLTDHNHSYGVQVVNGFLECLDGGDGRAGVLMIGATNDPAAIDPAILRAGRFDRVIAIARPSLEELPSILRHHLGSDLAASDLQDAARRALGGTGADCAAWVRRARGRARRAGRAVVEDDLLQEIAGAAGAACVEQERWAAIHECGHAVAARTLGLSVGDLVLRSPGHAGNGYMVFPTPIVVTRRVIRDMLVVLMAGRAAEILVFGSPSTGAEADLLHATRLAHDMHVRWGLGRRLSADGGRSTDAASGLLVEQALQSASRAALALLKMQRGRLERLARLLEARRSLPAVEVEALLR